MTLDTSVSLQPSTELTKAKPEGEATFENKEESCTGVQSHPDRSQIYGSFLIDNSEFAIPVSVVQEVVNEPNAISPVPLSPPHMLGLFNLRGMIIPIVDLRILLEYPQSDEVKQRKVAIIENNGKCIGLIFDKTGEVLSEKGAARIEFRPRECGIKDIVIEGVLKFDKGSRIVQILDPQELLGLEKLPRAANNMNKKNLKAARGKRQNCISFQTGRTSCAIDLRFVKEVREMPDVDQSLLAHGNIIGTTNLRGSIVPVIDFRGFMGDEAVFTLGATIPKKRKMLVVETLEGPIGLMVFSVDSILRYYSEDLLPFARFALPRSELISGCVIDENSNIVLMLDHEKLLSEPSLISAARSCQEVYPPDASSSDDDKQETGGSRLTYIQFTIERKFALDTSQVSEVINRPEELLKPPYSLNFIEGILNLRGELITIFDPRMLYNLSSEPDEGQKVLIFKHEGQKYGVLVDSVDEIITTTEHSLTDLKLKNISDLTQNVTDDITGCIHHTNSDGDLFDILLLNAGSMVDRCLRAAG